MIGAQGADARDAGTLSILMLKLLTRHRQYPIAKLNQRHLFTSAWSRSIPFLQKDAPTEALVSLVPTFAGMS